MFVQFWMYFCLDVISICPNILSFKVCVEGERERKRERERESNKKKFEVKYFMNLYFQDTVRLTEGST